MADPAYYAAIELGNAVGAGEPHGLGEWCEADTMPELTQVRHGLGSPEFTGWSFEWQYVDGKTYTVIVKENPSI
jgi:hypothetical protein